MAPASRIEGQVRALNGQLCPVLLADLCALRKPFNVTCDQVDLHIHDIADCQLPERRDGQRVWHQIELELCPFDLIDRQTYPIERDRSFTRDIALQRLGHAHTQSLRARIAPARHHLADAVDVSRDQMPPQRLARPQCGLADSPVFRASNGRW